MPGVLEYTRFVREEERELEKLKTSTKYRYIK
jgi:hypothetical protein